MSVAAHLGIRLSEYDARIRTFIPDYDRMLDVAAAAIPRNTRTIVDLGIGTGALASRCLRRAPGARVVGVDADADILALASGIPELVWYENPGWQRHVLAAGQSRLCPAFRLVHGTDLQQFVHYPFIGAPVQRTFERADGCRYGRIQIGECRGGHPRCKR